MPDNDQLTPPGAAPAANPGAPGATPANTNPGTPSATPPNPNPDPPKSWYGDDWRKGMSGGDEKIIKRLERFTDPSGVLKSYLAAEQKISSGEYKRSAKPENATPEQLAQWRSEAGIPDTIEGYNDIKIDEKLIVDSDKPYLEFFYKYAHESDIPKPFAEKFLNFLFNNRKELYDQKATRDKEQATETEEALRVDFGNDYLPNMNLMSGLLDGQPDGVKADFMEARLADGTLLRNDPDIVKMLVGFAREINPTATVLPNAGGANTSQSIAEEIASIQKFMRTNRDEYYKDAAKQKRYDQLLEAQAKLTKKAG